MLSKWILIAVLSGQPTTQVGTFETEQACTNAIREILMVNIYKGSRDTPQVVEAIDLAMKYQQEYICVKTK